MVLLTHLTPRLNAVQGACLSAALRLLATRMPHKVLAALNAPVSNETEVDLSEAADSLASVLLDAAEAAGLQQREQRTFVTEFAGTLKLSCQNKQSEK